jgi:hypothetical protein
MLGKKDAKMEENQFLYLNSFRFSQVVLLVVPSQHCHLEEHLCREGHSKP